MVGHGRLAGDYRAVTVRPGMRPLQSRPMSTRTPEERAASRAEARRRARLAARGEPAATEAETGEPVPVTRRDGGGLLARLFPSAPPLPNRTDPLAKFDRTGPLPAIRERVYLLRRNPVPWVLASLTCFAGYYASLTGGGSALGLLGTFLTFGSIIAAGWFGWQRPALFGTVTALIGFGLMWAVFLATFAGFGLAPSEVVEPLEVIPAFVLQAGLGYLGGWYGGYLRRRQAQVTADTRAARASRPRR